MEAALPAKASLEGPSLAYTLLLALWEAIGWDNFYHHPSAKPPVPKLASHSGKSADPAPEPHC